MITKSNKNHLSIVIIGCYIGEFPNYFDLWLKSCALNPTVNWLIYTDRRIMHTPDNVRIIYNTLEGIRKLAASKLGFTVALDYPYKLCDFKSVYGIIFEDDIKSYDFWGHCDFDMIFGNIRHFITDDILMKYDKILTLGHLTLYRNVKEVNDRFKLPGSNIDYHTAFGKSKHYAFDELGINEIYRKHAFPLYDERVFNDISCMYRRFRSVLLENSPEQLFFWENGCIYQLMNKNHSYIKHEYLYIHFKYRRFVKYSFDAENVHSFYIGPSGFTEKKEGIVEDADFDRINPYPGPCREYLEKSFWDCKEFMERIKNKLVQIVSNLTCRV
jgi:hypothetical protein